MMPNDRSFKVLVTGFGPFQDITTNPSWEIARHLPSSITGHDGEQLSVVAPPAATPAAYHKILAQLPQLLEKHSFDLILHIGLDVESAPGAFKVERSAPKVGYHDIPDIDSKVFTRVENKSTFGKAAASLVTTLDIDSATEMWQHACSSLFLPKPPPARGLPAKIKGKGKPEGRQPVNVQISDDVGTYACGFQYYTSMLEVQKRTMRRDVVFLHVPRLEGEEEIMVGVRVAEELIKALAGVLG